MTHSGFASSVRLYRCESRRSWDPIVSGNQRAHEVEEETLMKKWILLLAALVLLAFFQAAAAAEVSGIPDNTSVSILQTSQISALTYDELLAVWHAVENEMLLRPESEGRLLLEGVYLVGRDVQPGRFTISQYKSGWSSMSVSIYKDASKQNRISWATLNDDGDSTVVEIVAGNILLIEKGSAMMYYGDRAPKKDLAAETAAAAEPTAQAEPQARQASVGAGHYLVGEDIPAGTYRITTNLFDYTYVSLYPGIAEYEADIANGVSSRDSDFFVGEVYHPSFDLTKREEDHFIGKIVLKDGNVLRTDRAIVISEFTGISFH